MRRAALATAFVEGVTPPKSPQIDCLNFKAGLLSPTELVLQI